jgi:hypothetical protein
MAADDARAGDETARRGRRARMVRNGRRTSGVADS